jgi:Xaa-Pro aminopeptidase
MDTKGLKPELSLKEKERRWSLVRQSMKQEGLAAIIIYGDTLQWVPIRYLTNIFATGVTQQSLLFPADGEPIYWTSLPRIKFVAKRGSWLQPENIHCSVTWAEDLAKQLIALKLQNKRIGIDSFKTWPVRAYRILRGLCPDVVLVEAASLLGAVRTPKSGEEIKLIEEAVRIGELAQRTFLSNLKPGMKEEEVVGKVEDVIRANGVDLRLWLMLSAPGTPYPDIPGDTLIQRPNPVAFSSEFVRTRGYGCQVVRTYCWEEPKGEYKRMWELWGELRSMVPKELRPGRQISEVGAKIEGMVEEWGFKCDYLGHSVGLNMGDVPFISSGPGKAGYMEWTIMPNEVYVVHPMIKTKSGEPTLLFVGDMYLVGEEGTKWMTPFLSGLPEMIPG